VLGDQRHASHFAVVPRERWTAAMMPVADWLRCRNRGGRRVPYVLAVDEPTGCIGSSWMPA
jgi:hypothetical protein